MEAFVPVCFGNLVQAPGKVDAQLFARGTGGKEQISQDIPVLSDQVRFLGQLTDGGGEESSPSTSRRPAGISHSVMRTGCRYWLMSRIWPVHSWPGWPRHRGAG